MSIIHQSAADDSRESVAELFPELSTEWLAVDWDQLPRTKRSVAARLVGLGAAQVRKMCVIAKENAASPLIVTMVASGTYWDFLKERLTGIAAQLHSWRSFVGDLRIKTSNSDIRWTPDGHKTWRAETLAELVKAKAAPGRVEIESCRFADGTQFPEGEAAFPNDLDSQSTITWSVKDPADQPQAKPEYAILKLPGKCSVPLRSWRKDTLDTAILAYRDDPANEYLELRAQSSNPCDAYYRKAQSIFGRNAVARNLGVRGKAMVSKSPVWRVIAVELGLLNRATRPLPLNKYKCVSMKQGLGEHADAQRDCVVDDVIIAEARNEIKELFTKARSKLTGEAEASFLMEIIDAVLVMLDTGRRSPAEALVLARLAIEHVRDQQQRTIRKSP